MSEIKRYRHPVLEALVLLIIIGLICLIGLYVIKSKQMTVDRPNKGYFIDVRVSSNRVHYGGGGWRDSTFTLIQRTDTATDIPDTIKVSVSR